MQALVLDQPIQLDPRSIDVGNLWYQPNGTDTYHGRNPALLDWVYQRLALVDNPVLIDVGAHTGSFTLLAAVLPELRVYAFEPIFADVLAANVALNNLEERVYIHRTALGAHEGAGTMHVPDGTLGSHATLSYEPPAVDRAMTMQRVPLDTLDAYSDQWGGVVPTVIKIDVEGMEKFVIQGGERCIQAYQPDILFEFNAEHAQRFGYGPAQITRLLHSWGYTCRVKGNDAACIYGADKSEIWD